MAEFNYAEELNTNVDYDYITDVMTGDRDARMHLYFQLDHHSSKHLQKPLGGLLSHFQQAHVPKADTHQCK